jgi:hypothetical protein
MVSTPWQTYPGHAPCPLPIPEGMSYQWARRPSPTAARRARLALVRKAARALAAPTMPGDLVNRGTIAGALIAHGFGLRDASHLRVRCWGSTRRCERPAAAGRSSRAHRADSPIIATRNRATGSGNSTPTQIQDSIGRRSSTTVPATIRRRCLTTGAVRPYLSGRLGTRPIDGAESRRPGSSGELLAFTDDDCYPA